MGKKYNDVMEMMEDLKTSKTVKNGVEREGKEKMLAHYLFTLRCANKMTQKDIAKKLKCSQSKISKIESSFDVDLTIQDLTGYATACNLELSVGFRNTNAKIVDLIKFHAFQIQAYLDQLRNLASADDSMIDAILDFHEEAELNLNRIVRKSKSLLGANKKVDKRASKEEIHISPPLSQRQKFQEQKGISNK